MEVSEFYSCDREQRDKYLNQIEACEWGAAKFLAELLKENRLQAALGGWARLYMLVEGETLVSFITLSERDCISVDEFASKS